MKQMDSAEKELKIFSLASNFRNRYLRYDKRVFNLKTVKTSKWWPFFSRVVDYFGNNEEWDGYKYVNYLFDKLGKILPFELTKKNNWNDYVDFYKSSSIEVAGSDIQDLLSSFKKIRHSIEINEYKSYKELVEKEKSKIIFGAYPNSIFFYFIKSFNKLIYSEMKEKNNFYNFMSPEQVVALKNNLVKDEKIKNKLKIVLKEEFDIDDVNEYNKGLLRLINE